MPRQRTLPSRALRPLAMTLAVALAFALALGAGTATAADPTPDPDLRELATSSLEQLMNIKVFTVTGAPQSRLASPAAVYVISGEDLRRSGHRSVVEALRLVPGMYVGQVNSSSWIAGTRGLTGSTITSNRYLVLIDGRLVYDPLVSATFWDTVDTPLEDVDRIEVIRGPGATLWGANAMNGVINIVTKSAENTLGGLVQLGTGDQDPLGVLLRHGAAAGPDASYRVWMKYDRHGDFETADGTSLHDAWTNLHGGFRYDRQVDPSTTLTVTGDAYIHPDAGESLLLPVPGQDRQTERVTGDAHVTGANLLLRFNRGFGTPQGWRLRAYYDQTARSDFRFGAERQTADVDLRVWRHWGEHQDLMWGGELLWTRDRAREAGPVLSFDPVDRAWSQANAFVQNTSELVPDRLSLMLGSKFTWHEFTGFDVQPSARLWWTPDARKTLWAAVSRPVRMPSRFEVDGRLVLGYADLGALLGRPPNGIIVPLAVTGDDALRSEKMTAWELGYRFQPSQRWLIEASLFHNEYQRLIEPAPTVIGAFTDAGSGTTRGLELNASAQVTDAWRLEGGYSWLDVEIDGPVYQFEERSSPSHMAQLHSYLDLGNRLELNGALYHDDRIEQAGVPAYTRMDVGLTWYPGSRARISLWGQNLLDAGHAEGSGAVVPRNVYLQLSFDLAR
jgi:iron complex outermembrane receptor protein